MDSHEAAALPEHRDFWQALEALVAGSRVVIDRPAASRHPNWPQRVYPLDYGYLEGTTAADGDGIDLWLGREGGGEGNRRPAAMDSADGAAAYRVTGAIVTVDLFKRDAEIKVLLNCSAAEARAALALLDSGPMAARLLERPGPAQ